MVSLGDEGAHNHNLIKMIEVLLTRSVLWTKELFVGISIGLNIWK